jgi:diguanylate cyclase (GGDEF)-like protein/PAS domain S-box-containing protein
MPMPMPMPRRLLLMSGGEVEHRLAARRWQAVVEHARDLVVLVDASGTPIYLNPAIEEITGLPAESLRASDPVGLVHPDDAPAVVVALATLDGTTEIAGPVLVRIRHTDGTWRWLEITAANHLADPEIAALVVTGRDVSDRVLAEQAVALERERYRALSVKLALQVLEDPLTGLANRIGFELAAAGALEALGPGETAAMLFVDLDDFKRINDTFGHAVGDAHLRTVASRLTSSVRPDDVVGRLGGDEFAILLADVGGVDDVLRLAGRIHTRLDDIAVVIDGGAIGTASIGIALARPGADASDVLARADAAMYAAKRSGRRSTVLADGAPP